MVREDGTLLHWRLGTMGFGYPQWRGVFYPDDLKPAEFLRYYAHSFDCIELDTTFHAAPPPGRLAHWAGWVGNSFRFCPKVPRRVTHELPVDQAAVELATFLRQLDELGDKLGVLLMQFGPSLTADQWPHVVRLLEPARRRCPTAVEFRHRSWGTPQTLKRLEARGVAMVAAEYAAPPAVVPITADFAYFRWIGEHNRYPEMNREMFDPEPRLEWWRRQIHRIDDDYPNLRTVWGFFNNDYAGYAVATAERMKRKLGLPVTPPPSPGLFG